MKRLSEHAFDAGAARRQLTSYGQLLETHAELRERDDMLPLFAASPDLCLLFSHYIPALRRADVLATEFAIYGDFRADLIVGDRQHGRYLLVEFEDGTPTSVFSSRTKAVPDWSPRFEGAFSQLVDWLWKLEDMRGTADFEHVFGRRDVLFDGLIVIGHGMTLDLQEQRRLRWREDKIRVDSKAVSILSYDDVLHDADDWLQRFYRV